MCRWLAYSGLPCCWRTCCYKPQHSLIDQSLHSRLGATTTNGDGFGIGWYGVGDTPGVFHSIEPAWNDRNLKDLATHLVSPLVFAHIRASHRRRRPADQLPPVPLRALAVDAQRRDPRVPDGEARSGLRGRSVAVPAIEGSTDTEMFFFLALTFGLEDDPLAAVEQAVDLIEETGRRHGVEHPIQMTVATTDGASMWAFRYSSEASSRSLFYSTAVNTLRRSTPTTRCSTTCPTTPRLIVSEPLGDLAGAWNEVPESTCGVVHEGQDELRPFVPRAA